MIYPGMLVSAPPSKCLVLLIFIVALVGCALSDQRRLPADIKQKRAVLASLWGDERRDYNVYLSAVERGAPLKAQPSTIPQAIKVGADIIRSEQLELRNEKRAISAAGYRSR